jgi:hypothetical protein
MVLRFATLIPALRQEIDLIKLDDKIMPLPPPQRVGPLGIT